MSATADIVIIGGGVNGTSTAFHLASMGARNVRLLERRHLAAGATGKSGALVRMHYTNEHESRLAIESLRIFREFSTIVGGDCGFEAPGFLQLVPPGYEAALRRNLARQQRLGVDTREVSRADVRALFPGCRVDDVGGAAWEPGSGYADPSATAFAFAAAAARLGVTIETGCHVTRILTEQGRVTGVETAGARVHAPVVVLAPGAWGQPLLDPLGLDFGLQPYRIQVSLFRWPAALTRKHPVVIDAGQKAWIRPVDGHLTLIGVELGAAYGGDPDKLHEGVDEGYVALCRERLSHRLPLFADSTMRGGWAGMIMMSPDGRPIIDQIPSVPGLYVMLGDSGTSFKTSPAIGRCLAEWILEGKPRIDLTPFRAARFAEGRPWVDEDHYGRERLTISR